MGSPGAAKTVITLGATDKNDAIADFSSRGPTADGRVKPDLCMPGVDIVAARAAGTQMGTPQTNTYYTMASGTSMATPHATGASALLLQAQPTLKPADVKALLMQTAKDLGLDANTEGTGRAQVFAAYQAIGSQPAPTPTPTPSPLPSPLPDGCKELLKRVFGG